METKLTIEQEKTLSLAFDMYIAEFKEQAVILMTTDFDKFIMEALKFQSEQNYKFYKLKDNYTYMKEFSDKLYKSINNSN